MVDTTEKILLRVEFDQSDAIKKVAELQVDINALTKANTELAKSTGTATKEYQENARLIKNLKDEQSALNKNIDASIAAFSGAEGSMQALNKNLIIATQNYKAMSSAERNSAEGKGLLEKIKSTSTELMKLEAQMNDHRRNVGNYSSAYNGLGNAINQVSREVPAFTNSMQTGFMAISNNLPILADEIRNLVSANKELQSQGKETKSVLGQIAGAVFSWQTLLSVGITLLTVYGKEMFTFIMNMAKGKEVMTDATEKFKALNEAYADSSVKNAAMDYVELLNQIKSSKQGFIEKDEVLKNYNDTIGRTLGFAQDINQAEKILIENKDKYIQAMAERAASMNIIGKAAELMVKKVQLESAPIAEQGILGMLWNGKISKETAEFLRREEIRKLELEINNLLGLAQSIGEESPLNMNKTPEQKEKARESAKQKAERERQKALDDLEKANNDWLRTIDKADKEYDDKMKGISASREQVYKSSSEQLKDFFEKTNAETTMRREEDAISQSDYETQLLFNQINFLEAQKSLNIQFYKETGEQEAKIAALKLKIKTKSNEDQKKLDEIRITQEISTLRNISGIISNAASMFDQSSEAFKTLAIAQALINTYSAAVAALAPPPIGLGPILGPIAAGVAISAGLLNVSKIQSTEIPKIGGAAAGGGDFMTKGPTLLLVGDNPGGVERVSVSPISGVGQTSIDPSGNLIKMAGGGSIVTGFGGFAERNGKNDGLIDYSKLAEEISKITIITKITELERVQKNRAITNGVSET